MSNHKLLDQERLRETHAMKLTTLSYSINITTITLHIQTNQSIKQTLVTLERKLTDIQKEELEMTYLV